MMGDEIGLLELRRLSFGSAGFLYAALEDVGASFDLVAILDIFFYFITHTTRCSFGLLPQHLLFG